MTRTGRTHGLPPDGAHRPYEATTAELLGEAGVMMVAAGCIALFGPDSQALPWLIIALLGIRFAVLYRRGDVIVFLLGVLLGGGNDVISMWREVYYYTAPTLLPVPIPIWMVVFWGEAFLFFRRLMRYGPFLGPRETVLPPVDLPLALDLPVLVLLRLTVYRHAADPWVPDTVFAVALLVRYLIVPPAIHERRLLLTILVLGPLYEIVLIAAGLYVHQNGFVFGMPVWLVVYWLFIFRLLKAVIDRIELWLVRHEPP